MSGLHDALEAYFRNGGPDTPISTVWHDGEEYWEAPAADIRALLAAQPAEPARSVEVPAEVVEMAAHAMYADNEVGEWENGHLDTLLQYRRAARIALEAAAPHLAPEVIVDHRPGETCSVAAEVDPETGFACSPAVPQPVDREALERVLRKRMQNSDFTAIKHEPVRTQYIDSWVEVFADAVMALLNGSEEPS